MKLRRLAQSSILLTSRSGETLLIDPGKYNLDPGRLSLDSFPTADVVVITHKHADHFDIELLKAMLSRSQPKLFTNSEIQLVLQDSGILSQTLNPGDNFQQSGFDVTAVQTDHVVRGELIVNFGVVIRRDGVSLYHTSDTRYIDPVLLPPETRADYLLLPISNRGVVMGIDDALVFASELHPKVTIPLHYDSPKDKGRVDPREFEQKGPAFGLQVRVLAFGEELEL